MRNITEQAIVAFYSANKFKVSNTQIIVKDNVTIMLLHGNEIAYRYNDPEHTVSIRDAGWASNTTKERLNGLNGVHIQQKKGQWYLNGEVWNGSLINIK